MFRENYTKEFILQAIKLVVEEGYTVKIISKVKVFK